MGEIEFWSDVLTRHFSRELIELKQNHKGYVNTSYEITVSAQNNSESFLLRRYRAGADEQHVRFEHELLQELRKQGFEYSPSPLPDKNGATYFPIRYDDQVHLCALFNFLPGEDRYSWDKPHCSREELRDAAHVLALYHSALREWKPCRYWKVASLQEKIGPMLDFRSQYDLNYSDPFVSLYAENNWLDKAVTTYIENLSLPYSLLPTIAIHGDYHPGNLKFTDGHVSGVFDFDWAELAPRCFDVGFAIAYFCTSWEENNDGSLLESPMRIFLGEYQKTMSEIPGIGPLRGTESKYLANMVYLGHLVIIHWALGDYFHSCVDSRKYSRYLRHSLRALQNHEHMFAMLHKIYL